MFDRYQVGPSSVSVHETRTVNEHRAPTDDSVRLLSEMEDKMLKRIVQSATTANSELAVSWVVLRPDFETSDHVLRYHFVLNRREITGTMRISYHKWAELASDKSGLRKLVMTRAAEHIAQAVLKAVPIEGLP